MASVLLLKTAAKVRCQSYESTAEAIGGPIWKVITQVETGQNYSSELRMSIAAVTINVRGKYADYPGNMNIWLRYLSIVSNARGRKGKFLQAQEELA